MKRSEPPQSKERSGLRLKVMVGVLGVILLGLGGVLLAVPDYFAGGALTGQFDRRGLPSQVLEEDGRRWLYGGPLASQRFDITETRLRLKNLRRDEGRETIPALIGPEFAPAGEADWMHEDERVLAVHVGDETKAYPILMLHLHEVVNDVVGGKPIFAAYCILADLAAVYDRDIAGRVHTFALSGHLYYDKKIWEGRLGFMLWDRETESLWWPPMGKAVSGPMMDTPLPVLDRALWSQTTWAEIKAKYPDVVVLKPGQRTPVPRDLQRYAAALPGATKVRRVAKKDLAPNWGENPDL